MLEHCVEGGPSDSGSPGAGFIFEDAAEGITSLLAPGTDVRFLLRDGEVLFVSTRIPKIGNQPGARSERGVGHGHIV